MIGQYQIAEYKPAGVPSILIMAEFVVLPH